MKAKNFIESFDPVFRPNARVLILGTMPGNESLRAAQYYAHPGNAFWPIITALCGGHAADPYEQRLQMLMDARVALWDVLQGCRRTRSVDEDIERSSMIPNDLGRVLTACPGLRTIAFNGGNAEKYFRQQIDVNTFPSDRSFRYVKLPSSSPAHARMTWPEKKESWRELLPDLAAYQRSNRS